MKRTIKTKDPVVVIQANNVNPFGGEIVTTKFLPRMKGPLTRKTVSIPDYFPLIEKLVNEGKWNQSEIADAVCKEFPNVQRPFVMADLFNGRNQGYNKFSKLIIKDPATNILKFE